MNRASIIDRIRRHQIEIQSRFGVSSISLFGSAARDEVRPDSDIDVLVDFEGGPTFDRYFGLKFFLEDALGRSVDLVTPPMLKPRLRKNIAAELVHVT
jgi:hypothetical protein